MPYGGLVCLSRDGGICRTGWNKTQSKLVVVQSRLRILSLLFCTPRRGHVVLYLKKFKIHEVTTIHNRRTLKSSIFAIMCTEAEFSQKKKPVRLARVSI